MVDLTGKRILLFIPSFFDLSSDIRDGLSKMGAIVDMYNERSISLSINRALLKVVPKIFTLHTRKYYSKILNDIRGNNYDYLFFINCQMPDGEVMKELHKAFPNTIFILYLWDSLANLKNIKTKFDYFDKIYSFDRVDCQNYPIMKFRPLFYLDNVKQIDCKGDYDICFIGTIHSDRYAVIQKVKKICDDNHYKFFTFNYLQSHFMYFYYKLTKSEFKGARFKNFSYTALSKSEINRIYQSSKAILDINHSEQHGITNRPIEVLNLHKKIITTCSDIKNYDFYCKDNILVIDREDPKIDDEFLNRDFKEISNDIMKRYTFQAWANEVFLSTKGGSECEEKGN